MADNTVCTLKWIGQSTLAPSISLVKLQVFNRGTVTWDDVDSDNVSGADVDFTLIGIVSLANYKDGNNVISCRVYQANL